MIRGIKFASIPVSDQDKAIAFYTQKLGFRNCDGPAVQRTAAMGRAGYTRRRDPSCLFQFDNNLKPGTRMNVSFWTDDVEGTVRELKAKGVKITMEATKADWGECAGFQDVDGNTFLVSSK